MTRPRDPQGRFVKAITASVSTLPSKALERLPRSASGWQERAWRLWRILGVLHYPTSFMAEQIMRLDWNVEIAGNLLEPEQAAEVMDAVTIGVGVDEASRRISLNLEVAGEVFYVRKADEWEVVSSAAAPQWRKEKLEGADIVVHAVHSDPVDPNQPDSPVRAALDVADEIRVIQTQSRSQSRNRASTRGILLVPKEVTFPEGSNFQADLEEALVAPSADEYHPSNATPLKVTAPGDTIEKWRHLVLDTAYDEKLQDRLDNAIKRLALSLNIPPEVLLGNLDSNHWNAWLSEEATYRGHLEPLAMLTGAVFAEAMMSATATQDIKVTPDPTELLARRSSVVDSFKAFELGVVGAEFVRRAMGADEDDAPTPDEIAARTPAVIPDPDKSQAPSAPSPNGKPVTAAVDDSDRALDALGRQLLALDMQLLGTLRGEARMAVELAMEKHDTEDIGAQERIASEMGRLGRAWRKDISDAHLALRDLGIEAKGPEWKQAAEVSVALLVDGMTVYVTDNLGKTASEMPALPTPLLREVMAAAGGSNTATVAAVSPTFQDPQGFAIGVLSLKGLKADGVELKQWRFRYGQLPRSAPFLPHKEQDGRFATMEGTVHGWFPGDHKGCLCALDPVFRSASAPEPV